ncbi:MAG TPA: hypothetical protein VHO07_30585 [Streptosporangiaceae bacterium]|nr:hypothetical protein [Streptosporangiaceae bacterium]
MNLEADRVAELADRPLNELTRRDVALALLTMPAVDALASLPGIRRGMLAAGNPLSAVFWSSAEAILQKIADGDATVGDVRTWLEATGTEPNGIIGLHVWDELSQRSQLGAEMHTRLVTHLEEQLAAGIIDPDLLATADPAACGAYIEIQERWMTSALPDGRVPMDALLDEKDEEFLAEWDAADAEALALLQAQLDQAGDRRWPREDLHRASTRLRELIAKPGWPGQLLIECGGVRPEDLPADDAELWLRLAAGVASPEGSDDWGAPGGGDGDGEPHETDSAIAAICSIDHFDWLAVMTALAAGGPGTSASAADLAAYVRDYDPDDGEPGEGEDDDEDEAGYGLADAGDDDDEDFDELGMEDLFLPVTALWQVLGAIDDDERLTPLGWWGLPEAMRIVWAPSDGTPG